MTIGIGWSSLPFHLIMSNKATLSLSDALKSGELRIAVPQPGTSDELTFRRILSFYRTSYDQLKATGSKIVFGSYDELVSHFANGRVDDVFGATAASSTAVVAMGERPARGRLLPLPEELMEHLNSSLGYRHGKISAGTYPGMQEADVATAGHRSGQLYSAG
jgi:uncharacterized protein